MLGKIFDSGDKSLELSHVLGVLLVVFFGVLSGWSVMAQGQPFDPVAWGTGSGVLLGGIGGLAFGQGAQRKAEGQVTQVTQ